MKRSCTYIYRLEIIDSVESTHCACIFMATLQLLQLQDAALKLSTFCNIQYICHDLTVISIFCVTNSPGSDIILFVSLTALLFYATASNEQKLTVKI